MVRWFQSTSFAIRHAASDCAAPVCQSSPQKSRPVIAQASRSGNQGRVIAGDVWEAHGKVCRWLRKKGVKDSKPVHFLRKCYGSLAVADHGIFVASKLLGHSSINLTASTYAGQVDRLPAVKF
jgi:integrase